MTTFKYRTLADLQAFRTALEEVQAHSQKMAAMGEATNLTMMSNLTPANLDSALALGSAAMKVALEEMEALGTAYEKAVVRFLGEARRSGESVEDYSKRISSLNIEATQRRNGIMVLPW